MQAPRRALPEEPRQATPVKRRPPPHHRRPLCSALKDKTYYAKRRSCLSIGLDRAADPRPAAAFRHKRYRRTGRVALALWTNTSSRPAPPRCMERVAQWPPRSWCGANRRRTPASAAGGAVVRGRRPVIWRGRGSVRSGRRAAGRRAARRGRSASAGVTPRPSCPCVPRVRRPGLTGQLIALSRRRPFRPSAAEILPWLAAVTWAGMTASSPTRSLGEGRSTREGSPRMAEVGLRVESTVAARSSATTRSSSLRRDRRRFLVQQVASAGDDRPDRRERTMVIVAGHVTVEPQQRESYVAGCVSIVERARGADLRHGRCHDR